MSIFNIQETPVAKRIAEILLTLPLFAGLVNKVGNRIYEIIRCLTALNKNLSGNKS